MELKNNIKTLFNFSKDQRKGILLLFFMITGLQVGYYFLDFNKNGKQSPEELNWLSLQSTIDTLKSQKQGCKYYRKKNSNEYILVSSHFKSF